MTTVLIGLAALAVLCLFGVPVLALLPGSARYRLLPGLPVFGVVFLIVLNHALVWALPVSTTAWIAVAVAVAVTILGCWRRPVRWRSVKQVAPFGAAVVGVGGIGAVLAWVPSFLVRTNLLVQPSSNLDAVWYVSSATWLENHTLLQAPDIGLSPTTGTDAVFFGPPAEAVMNATRLGQEMVLATLSSLTGIDLVDGFSAWLGIWVLLSASAAWVFGEMFRLGARARLLLALLLSVSSVVIYQATAQNASSLLGVALVVAAIGAVGSALRRDGRRAVPRWVAGATVAAAIGAYSEFLPFLAVALVSVTLIAPRGSILPRVGTALVIVGFSVLLAPVVWFRSISSTLFVGGIASRGGGETDVGAALFGFLGPLATMITETTGKLHYVTIALGAAVALVAVAGIVLGLISRRTRGFVVGAGLGSLVIAGYLIFSANSYVGHRAVDMITPLVTLSAAVGWIEFNRRAQDWPAAARRVLAVVTVGALVGVVGVNFARSLYGVTYRVWSDRVVSQDFTDVGAWADSTVDVSGDDLTVAVGTVWDQLWVAEALRDRPDAAWINLRGDLGYRANAALKSFWDGEIDRYLLAGPGAFLSPDVVPVDRNQRFALVDWDATPGVVAVPDATNGEWEWNASEGISSFSGPAGVRVIAGSRGGSYVLGIDRLTPGSVATATIDGASLEVPVSSDGSAAIPFTIAARSSIEIIVLPAQGFRLQNITQEAQ